MTDRGTQTISPARVLLPLGLGTALSLMGDATLYTVLPTHTADAGVALSSVGILLGANRVVRLFLNGPAGIAYDRFRRRWLFVPALFVGALSTSVYAATKGFWPLLIGRLLWGLAWSGIWVGGTTMILAAAPEHSRGRWTGWYQTWYFLGAAFGASAGGFLTDRMGYTTTMWIASGLTAVGGLLALVLLPETQSVRGGSSASWTPEESSGQSAIRRLWLVASLQLVNRLIISGVLASTLGLLVQERIESQGAVLGVATLTGVLMAGRTLLSTAAAPLAGMVSDWTGDRWRVVAGGLSIGAIGMALLAWRAPAAIVVGILLGSVASGSVQTLVAALSGDLVDVRQRGRAIGLMHTASDLGSAVGPVAAYALLPWVGLGTMYWLCAAIFGLELILTIGARPKMTKQPDRYADA